MSNKVDVDPNRFFAEMMERMTGDGLLLATVDGRGKPNVMTIGWGTMGSIWGKPVFLVLVRPSRFSYRNLEETGEFTVNVPGPDMSEAIRDCGTLSGRDTDKFERCRLTPMPGRRVKAPIIDECSIHYECRVVHKNDVQPPALEGAIRSSAYRDGDYHRIYWGEILRACANADPSGRVPDPRL